LGLAELYTGGLRIVIGLPVRRRYAANSPILLDLNNNNSECGDLACLERVACCVSATIFQVLWFF
jgi:hypothetical protein